MSTEHPDYFKLVRFDLIDQLLPGPNRVLEVGCAEGWTGAELKRRGCVSEVVGIELNPKAAAKARKQLDQVICGDLENLSLDESFMRPASFDYIIVGDVLEHLRDPWGQLAKLSTCIKPQGRIIASIPNVRHWSVLLPLCFRGEWTYCSHGILDSTHLRFFTKNSATSLFHSAGLSVQKCQPSLWRRYERVINWMSFGLMEEFLAEQWVLTGVLQNRRAI